MIKRIILIIKRNIKAHRLGISKFLGIGNLRLPAVIKYDKKKYNLNYPTNDLPTANLVFIEVFLDDCYQLGLIKHPIKKIMDIGANMGFASLYMSIFFQPDLLIAFEPNPSLIDYLHNNLRHIPQLHILNKAVGKEDGKANLVFTERMDHLISGLTKTELNNEGTTEIVDFSRIIKEYGPFDLVKMDCEGGEWAFLDDDAWRNVKYLTMEYHLSKDNEDQNSEALYFSLSKNFIILKEYKIDELTGMILAKNKI